MSRLLHTDSLPQMLAMVEDRITKQVVGSQALEPTPLLPWMWVSRKLESGASAGSLTQFPWCGLWMS